MKCYCGHEKDDHKPKANRLMCYADVGALTFCCPCKNYSCKECGGTGKADGTEDSPRCSECYCEECGFAPCQCVDQEQGTPCGECWGSNAHKAGCPNA